MDEMLHLNGGFVSKLLIKILEHEIQKKCGCKVCVTLNELSITNSSKLDGLINVQLNTEFTMKHQDLKQLVSKTIAGGD